MKLVPPRVMIPALVTGVVLAFSVGVVASVAQEDVRLPNGKLQKDEILKAEHEANVKDVNRLVEASQELQQEIEKNDRFVLSLSSLKKADEIEKLIKQIRTRLRRN
jgi:uncharacterized protein YlxW (UPF0749 family)